MLILISKQAVYRKPIGKGRFVTECQLPFDYDNDCDCDNESLTNAIGEQSSVAVSCVPLDTRRFNT